MPWWKSGDHGARSCPERSAHTMFHAIRPHAATPSSLEILFAEAMRRHPWRRPYEARLTPSEQRQLGTLAKRLQQFR